MFRQIQSYMGDASPSGGEESAEAAGDEAVLRDILRCGRSNLHLACELYCQLVKQTHRCVDAEKEVGRSELWMVVGGSGGGGGGGGVALTAVLHFRCWYCR